MWSPVLTFDENSAELAAGMLEMRSAEKREVVCKLRERIRESDGNVYIMPHEEEYLDLAEHLEAKCAREHSPCPRREAGPFAWACRTTQCGGEWRLTTKPPAEPDGKRLPKSAARVCEKCGAQLGLDAAQRACALRYKREAERRLLAVSAQRVAP